MDEQLPRFGHGLFLIGFYLQIYDLYQWL